MFFKNNYNIYLTKIYLTKIYDENIKYDNCNEFKELSSSKIVKN